MHMPKKPLRVDGWDCVSEVSYTETNHVAKGGDEESGVDIDTSGMSRATRTGQGRDIGAIFVLLIPKTSNCQMYL